MPTIFMMTIDGHELIPDKLTLITSRETQPGALLSPNMVTLSFQSFLEMESDSDTFFADWMAQPFLARTVEIGCLNSLTNQTYLNMKLENALCTGYTVDGTGTPSLEAPAEANASFFVTVVAPKVTIGQAPIEKAQ
jgi:hypothetical protein